MSLAGTRIDGHYTLLRPLGKGATSTVYLALGDDGEPYTVKLFPAHLAEQAVRESQMRVRGPHLAEVMMLCEVKGQPAVVLRFTRGVELFTRYRFRPALIYETQAYRCTLSNILEALSAMHAGGILHRDVKADNILVRPSGEAQLLDYDLSGPVSEVFDLPRRIGTAAFQSPEALRGEALGPQSDLYGVGVLMYWGLHGRLPDDGRAAGDPQRGAAGRPLLEVARPRPRHPAQQRRQSAGRTAQHKKTAGSAWSVRERPCELQLSFEEVIGKENSALASGADNGKWAQLEALGVRRWQPGQLPVTSDSFLSSRSSMILPRIKKVGAQCPVKRPSRCFSCSLASWVPPDLPLR